MKLHKSSLQVVMQGQFSFFIFELIKSGQSLGVWVFRACQRATGQTGGGQDVQQSFAMLVALERYRVLTMSSIVVRGKLMIFYAVFTL